MLRQVFSTIKPAQLRFFWLYRLYNTNPDPRADYLAFVKTYLDSGIGGIYMSGPVSQYRKDRIEWDLSQSEYQVIGKKLSCG